MEKGSNREIALKTLKQQAQDLQDQIRTLKIDLEAITRAYDVLAHRGDQRSLFQTTQTIKRNEFENMTVQKAILKILNDHPDDAFRPAEISKLLLQGGIKTSSNNFLNIVTSTILRLSKEETIERIQTEGLRGSKYKAKAEG